MPFMQTAIPHENHVDGFFLTHIQSPNIINLTSILPYHNSPNIQGYSDTPLYHTWKGFEAIVMFWGYFDSLVFLLIHLLSIKAEPVRTLCVAPSVKDERVYAQ